MCVCVCVQVSAFLIAAMQLLCVCVCLLASKLACDRQPESRIATSLTEFEEAKEIAWLLQILDVFETTEKTCQKVEITEKVRRSFAFPDFS